MDLFWRLLLAHFIADFPLQFKAIRDIKNKWYGLVSHALIFGIVSVVMLVNLREIDYYDLGAIPMREVVSEVGLGPEVAEEVPVLLDLSDELGPYFAEVRAEQRNQRRL